MNVSSEEKYCQSPSDQSLAGRGITGRRGHKTRQISAQLSYDETPLADSCGSSVVHTCKAKAISLPLKFLPFSNRPLFHSSPNKSHFPHSILARFQISSKHSDKSIPCLPLHISQTPNQPGSPASCKKNAQFAVSTASK